MGYNTWFVAAVWWRSEVATSENKNLEQQSTFQKIWRILIFTKKIFFELLNRLPPGHPKAKITEAASHVREMIQNQIHMEPDQDDLEDDSEDEEEEDEHAMDLDSDMVTTLFAKINVELNQPITRGK